MVGVEKIKVQAQNSITEIESPMKKKKKELQILNLSAQKTAPAESAEAVELKKQLENSLQ